MRLGKIPRLEVRAVSSRSKSRSGKQIHVNRKRLGSNRGKGQAGNTL